MGQVVGQWRATYTPGDWVLLSGPTSLVLMEPPPPRRSSMITVLWEEVVASSSMTELAGRLAAYPLDSLPSFACFFWTGDGMRSLVRGGVSVVDLDSGVTVAEGEGIQTWTEVGLDQVSQILVETQAGEGTRLELPLVVGAVRASSVRLDASEAARVSSPQMPVPSAEPAPTYAEEAPAYADEPAYAEEAPTDADEPASPEEAPAYADKPAYAESSPSGYADAPDAYAEGSPPADADDETPEHAEAPAYEVDPTVPAGNAVQGEVDLPGPTTEPLDDPFVDDPGEQSWRPDAEAAPDGGAPDQGSWAEQPWSPEPAPTRAYAAEGLGAEYENADTQLMSPPDGSPERPAEAADPADQNSLIMSVVCQYGHASAQNATTCRICGSAIAPQGPRLVPRPVLAVLRSSDGTVTEVDRAVLVGRAPSGQRSNARAPRLMTVPSPGHDISRTHLEVAPEGWSIVVTDLHSTNGTILVHPGGVERSQLPPGDAVPVQLGSVVELGDGISVLIDFPQ